MLECGGFLSLSYYNGVYTNGEIKDGEREGTQEHGHMARATASCTGKRDEKKGQAGAEGERQRGTGAACTPCPEAPLVPGPPPPWPPKIPPLVLLLALVAT